MSAALFQRLDTFVGKMKEKQAELLAEAQEGCAGLMEDFPEDPLPLGNALTGVGNQMSQLRDRIEEVWDNQIEKLFDEQAPSEADRARDLKDDAKRDLEEAWSRFQCKTMATFYRNLHPRAVAALREPVTCTRCGAVLRERGVRRTEAVTCQGCGTVTQVVPHTAVSQYFGGGGHAFGEEAALSLRFAVERFRVEVDRDRRAKGWAPESVESLDRWVAMEQAYWDRYAEVRAQAAGEPVDAEFVKSRMDAFKKYSVEMDQRWRKAKGLS